MEKAPVLPKGVPLETTSGWLLFKMTGWFPCKLGQTSANHNDKKVNYLFCIASTASHTFLRSKSVKKHFKLVDCLEGNVICVLADIKMSSHVHIRMINDTLCTHWRNLSSVDWIHVPLLFTRRCGEEISRRELLSLQWSSVDDIWFYYSQSSW